MEEKMTYNKHEPEKIRIPEELPVLPIKGEVVFPVTIAHITVDDLDSAKLVDEAYLGDKIIGVVTWKDEFKEKPSREDLYKTGTAVHILRMLKTPDNRVHLLLHGISRIILEEFTQTVPYFKAKIKTVFVREEDSPEIQALTRNIYAILEKIASSGYIANELYAIVLNIKKPGVMADIIGHTLNIPIEKKQELLETFDIKTRLEKTNVSLNKELQVSEMSLKIQSDIKQKLDKTQREYILREQLKAIKKELGEESELSKEIRELKEGIKNAKMPAEVQKETDKELDRMAKIPSSSPEYTVSHTYLEWLVSLPWTTGTEDNLDIKKAQEMLDEDHYNLKKVKERILEFLAVHKLKKDTKIPILCLVGPPGVGKTSLGKSIARALGRKFIRVSLGGIRDEADIRGHRRTYIGALPGRIIQGIRRAGSNNPVFMIDEVDKIGADFHGDPASALLEVLDPEQNNSFSDHYLDVPFDLSKVMFIATANIIDTIPGPLRDRMEIITLPGYTEEEKLMIARKYLIPRQLENHGITPAELKYEDEALLKIIRDYTREAGLRSLEREIAAIHRKTAVEIVRGEKGAVTITPHNISGFLGPVKFFSEVAERIKQPGVAIGLAWTQSGGDIIFVEATRMKGRKAFVLTGQLGDVMKESAQAALSYIRSNAKCFGIGEDFFDNNDIHIHVPAGAIPKDGPSAGVTMAVALASLLTERKVVPYVAMTGEITLRGTVLPVGGIKEKILAAKRTGIKTVLLPEKNEKDLNEVPEEVKKELKIYFIRDIKEAIEKALAEKRLIDGIMVETGGHLPAVTGAGELAAGV
jgi:ATP-dependent Lon protease